MTKKQYNFSVGGKVRLSNGDTAVIQGRLKGYGGTEAGKQGVNMFLVLAVAVAMVVFIMSEVG